MAVTTAPPRQRHVVSVLSLTLFLFLLPAAQAVPYTHLTYAQLHRRLVDLAAANPRLLTITSAQKAFSLPHVGNCTQLASATDTVGAPAPCTIWVVQLTNHTSMPADPTRPELFVSGEVHGDEVVGPLAVLAFIEHLLSRYGRDDFATRLIDTRVMTLVPMTNAVGFHRVERFERQSQRVHPLAGVKGRKNELPNANLPDLRLDPNRDFPYDQLSSKRCLRTVAARALNELFLRHVFRLVVTFHGGTNVLAYEWGDSTHCNNSQICPPAPDTAFMRALAERMATFAGPAGAHEPTYPIGDMGKLVYPVHGGMEDWAYGAGWTSGGNVICRPDTLGGLPRELSRSRRGDAATKRAVTYLVEMSIDKKPAENTLGDSDAVLRPGDKDDGHVPRNVRLLLSLADAAEPYVALEKPDAQDTVRWRVGGAFSVDGAVVQWSSHGGANSGESTRQTGKAGVPGGGANGTLFEWKVADDVLQRGGSEGVFCRVAVLVDQTLARRIEGAVPDVGPQSHVMGGRASKSWKFEADGRKIVGRFVFYSDTVLVQRVGRNVVQRVVPQSRSVQWRSDVGTGALHARSDMEVFESLVGGDGSGVLLTATSAGGGADDAGALVTVLAAGAAGLLGFVLLLVVVRWLARRRSKAAEQADLDAAFSLDEDDEERAALRPIGE